MNKKDYIGFQKNPDLSFDCINCRAEFTPFASLDDNKFDIAVTKGVNYLTDFDLKVNPSTSNESIFNNIDFAVQNIDLSSTEEDQDDDESEFHPISCKYYSVDEFIALKANSNKYFSNFHLNIHSIEQHIEELRILLELLNFSFDFICISESKIEKNYEPKIDIGIDGYECPISKPTEATKGGVLIYSKKGMTVILRTDLSDLVYKSKELESVFLEVIGESKSLVWVIYWHPCMNEKTFNEDYLKPLNERLSSENKHCYLSGDFNFDLLNLSSHEETSNFFEIMMTNLLMPCITLPTKINPGRSSVIDNIFTNNIHPDILSGNFTINLSDGHLPSFMLIPKKIKTTYQKSIINIKEI